MEPESVVGRPGEPFPLEVERGKIYEFARATRNEDAACWAERPVSPPTFLTTQFHWALGASDVTQQLDLDWSRCLHAAQSYEFPGPPPSAGDRLVGRSRVTDVHEKRSRNGSRLRFADVVTEFRDESDALVAVGRLTLVEVGDPGGAS